MRLLLLPTLLLAACEGSAVVGDDDPTDRDDGGSDTDVTVDPTDTDTDADADAPADTDAVDPDCLYARVLGVAYVGDGSTWSGRIERVVGRDCPTANTRCHLEWSGVEAASIDPSLECPTCLFAVRVRWAGRQDVLNFEEGRESRCGKAFDRIGGTPESFEQTYYYDADANLLWRHAPAGLFQYGTQVDYTDGTLTYRVDLR